MKYLKNAYLLIMLLGLYSGFNVYAVTILGTGSGALLGSDLTDPENDINDSTLAGANFNWISATASSEPNFGGEGAFDVFDNQVGSGSTKWCCSSPPQNVAVQFANQYILTHFTIAAGNDAAGRDPDIWYIEGSNDGSSWTPIYTYDAAGISPFSARLQVLRFDSGADFLPPVGYSYFRYRVESVVTGGHQINELEFFGTIVPMADLSITITDSPDPVIAGNSLTYTVIVNNAGPSDAINVSIADALPAGVYNPITSGCTEDPFGVPNCSLGTITAGASAQFTITVDVGASTLGTITNSATVSSMTADNNLANNTIVESTTVNAQADLSITMTDNPDPVIAGNSLTYTVTVNNAGPSDAASVVVTETLPAGVVFVSTTGCLEDPTGVPTCTLGTIVAGGMAQYMVNVAVDSSTLGVINNSATVSSSTTDNNLANNTIVESTTVNAQADLSIVLTSPAANVVTPGPFTYVIDVTNAGLSDATNVVVTDILSVNNFGVETTGCFEDPNGYQDCSLGNLAPGETASYAITFILGSIDGEITNTVSVTSDATDPTPANNTSSSVISGTIRIIPTLSQWGLLMIMFLIGLFGFRSIARVESK